MLTRQGTMVFYNPDLARRRRRGQPRPDLIGPALQAGGMAALAYLYNRMGWNWFRPEGERDQVYPVVAVKQSEYIPTRTQYGSDSSSSESESEIPRVMPSKDGYKYVGKAIKWRAFRKKYIKRL